MAAGGDGPGPPGSAGDHLERASNVSATASGVTAATTAATGAPPAAGAPTKSGGPQTMTEKADQEAREAEYAKLKRAKEAEKAAELRKVLKSWVGDLHKNESDIVKLEIECARAVGTTKAMSREHCNELKKTSEKKDGDRVRWQLEVYDHIRRLKNKVGFCGFLGHYGGLLLHLACCVLP